MKYFPDHSIRIGISACLVGDRVRYDGAHKRHDWLADHLGRFVTWVRVCPEVELGLGVPRETISLIRLTTRAGAAPTDRVRLVASRTGRDLTDAMERFARARVEALACENLAGYVLKSKSPSCGLDSATIVHGGHASSSPQRGRGLFAAALVARWPDLPVVEDSELDTPERRDRFVRRVRAYHAGRAQ